jgi:hypothetical protein
LISAFVLFHLSAIAVWTMPDCEIKGRCMRHYKYYVVPLGVWQWWSMFAPEPIKETHLLDAEVIDAKGMRHFFEFPRIGDLPWYAKVGRYRQPKFTANMSDQEFRAQREFAARHAIRQLGLTADVFPVMVNLYYQLKPAPPPGTSAYDPMERPLIKEVGRYLFPKLEEVRP